MGRLAALCILALIGCAALTPPPVPPASHAEDDWHEHVGALILRVRSPRGYLVIPNAFPFHLYVDLLERGPTIGRYREPFMPLEMGSGRETVWDRDLYLTAFLNTARFVRHGYLAIRPTGLTRVPNPLRTRCPRDLVDAAVSDMRGQHLLVLETRPVGRVDHYGCVYRFRLLVE